MTRKFYFHSKPSISEILFRKIIRPSLCPKLIMWNTIVRPNTITIHRTFFRNHIVIKTHPHFSSLKDMTKFMLHHHNPINTATRKHSITCKYAYIWQRKSRIIITHNWAQHTTFKNALSLEHSYIFCFYFIRICIRQMELKKEPSHSKQKNRNNFKYIFLIFHFQIT